jgi:hypothetical protein
MWCNGLTDGGYLVYVYIYIYKPIDASRWIDTSGFDVWNLSAPFCLIRTWAPYFIHKSILLLSFWPLFSQYYDCSTSINCLVMETEVPAQRTAKPISKAQSDTIQLVWNPIKFRSELGFCISHLQHTGALMHCGYVTKFLGISWRSVFQNGKCVNWISHC